MTIKSQVRPLGCPTMVEITNWCREYMHYGAYPCNFMRRFGIGFYQIHQGVDWAKTDSEMESFAAACLHFIMVMEELGLRYEETHDVEYASYPWTYMDWKALTYSLSFSMAHLIYKTNETHVARRNRYRPLVLQTMLSSSIYILVCSIKPELRYQAFYDAMEIMCGRL